MAPASRVVKTLCPMNCHPTFCGMEVHVEGDRLVDIKGDVTNPDSRGFLCQRGHAAREIIGNPLRLARPLRRAGPRGGGRFEPVSWDAALDEMAFAMRRAGRERVALWRGHGSLVNELNRYLIQRFGNLYGCHTWNAAITCWTLGAYGLMLTGVPEANTREDMAEHSRTIIMWGANVVSQPTTVPYLVAARRRGARVIAIDVRRTETARHADEVLLVRPGTDSALALAMMHLLVAEHLVDRPFVDAHTVGFEPLVAALREHTPEWGAEVTGLPADAIRRLARRYATEGPSMIVLGGSSIHKYRTGWQAARAIACLPALTGQLGVPGGGLGPRHRAVTHGEHLGDILASGERPPGDYVPSHMTAMNDALLAGRIDVLILLGTNMLSSYADANRAARGLERVGLVVAHDLFENETTRRYADLVLPGTAWLEEVGIKDTATHVYLTDRALPPAAEARSMTWLLRALAARLGVPTFFPWADEDGPIDALVGGMDGGTLSVARMRREDNRYARRISPVAHPDRRFPTPSGKVELYSAQAEALGLPPLPVFEEPEETPRGAPERARRYPLVFRQGRTFTAFHAFYDEGRALPSLRDADPEPILSLNPADAEPRGIATGAPIELFNDRGRLAARALVTDDVPPGLVWMRDGWVGINALTSGTAALSPAQSGIFAFPGGQASYEALVEVRAA
jgi:anaerobic selenocysteine-containing dehydrogenase